MAEISPYVADERGRPTESFEVVTSAGTRLYALPVETFPGHVNLVVLIDHPDGAVLFDVGTASADDELDRRFAEIRKRFGVRTGLADVREAVVSHAHIDHFGNAGRLRAAGVPVAVHERDAPVLASFQERLVLASRDLGVYLRQAGLEPEAADRLTAMHRSGKSLFRDQAPERVLGDGETVGPGWPTMPAPGHCPGMICVAVDDVVLTADLLLSRITPVQSPRSITAYTGLEHYLDSLAALEAFGAFALGIGAHEAPIVDVRARIEETRAHHRERLARVRDLCAARPRTIAGVARDLFGVPPGYTRLLALLETGAHVERLHETGAVAVVNLDEVAARPDAAARYAAV